MSIHAKRFCASKIKALVLDLDGTTLAPGAALSERTIRAVKTCKKRGLKVIIATGRATESAERYRAALGLEGPMIYFNGAVVADMPENKILKATLLDKKAVEFCVELSREMGVYYHVFFPVSPKNDSFQIKLMAEFDTPERKQYQSHTGISIELADIKKFLKQPEITGCLKGMFVAGPEKLAAIRQRLEQNFCSGVYITQSMNNFLEVLDKNVSKGRALGFVMEHLSLKKEEVMAFGDEENDLPMFAAAGFSAAPSSANESIKAQADIVLASNADDGVAAFLEKNFG